MDNGTLTNAWTFPLTASTGCESYRIVSPPAQSPYSQGRERVGRPVAYVLGTDEEDCPDLRLITVATRPWSRRRFSQVSRSVMPPALALGMVSAGAHDQAVRLLARVSGSTRAVGDLSKLVAIKTAAQYTGKSMAARRATDAIKQAQRPIAFAESQRRR